MATTSCESLRSYWSAFPRNQLTDQSRRHLQRFAPGAETACLFHFDEPVSPHLAVERAAHGQAVTKAPTDSEFAAAVGRHARNFARESAGKRSSLYIESAGGEPNSWAAFGKITPS